MSDLSSWVGKNKELWMRVYDEVITPDLEKEWKKRMYRALGVMRMSNDAAGNEEHEEKLKSKDEEHQILLAHVNNEIITAARLREENARLKRLLQKQNNGSDASPEQLQANTPDAKVPAADYRHITDKFNELNKRYQSDVQKMKYLERKNVTVMQKNKEMKESVRAWQEYCDHRIGKQKVKIEMKAAARDGMKPLTAIDGYVSRPSFPSSPAVPGTTTPNSLADQGRSSPAPLLPLAHVTNSPSASTETRLEFTGKGQLVVDVTAEQAEQDSSLAEETTPTNARSATRNGEAALLGRQSSPKLTSSQTTEDETAEQNNDIFQMDAEDEDDTPQFVSERSLKRKRKPSARLGPLDPNVMANVNGDSPNKRMKKAEMREREKYEFILESGETPPIDKNIRREPPSAARARYNQKLRAFKEGHTPSKATTNTPKTAPAKIRAAPKSSSTSRQTHLTPTTRALQRPEPRTEPPGRPIWTMAPPSESTRKPTTPAPPPKQKGPLRSKPVEQLCVQDFKPNPAYNQGYTHAFSETVRKRSDRLCLPGCTKSDCCGSTFRSLALAAAPLSSSQEEDLLQDYLGDAYDSFGLTQMSQDERQEVVLQARTRQMAKQHGKHRQTYERGRSPPGFWRTGFPSTQEIEADKAKAKEIEKELVEGRWLEAMRKGGKWIFRDE
ncbi:SAE2-domain-containing protein [Massarina eburnea CBS 473.64]|uniref:SAE2-domain-containing protein n=1 Tax=Massarina eburnea CBS 473.64 TaxID=1395130 RepID=A0A6A6RZM0_9PLEO|nr:SAE2-domain-containing protein [Massarina eburnea CBS 473.64]